MRRTVMLASFRTVLLTLFPFAALAQIPATPPSAAPAVPTASGSPSFCLFEVPGDDANKRRQVNLAHVQYVEVTASDVRLYYGGGNFGAGHEARIPAPSAPEAQAVVEKLRKAAAACMAARPGS